MSAVGSTYGKFFLLKKLAAGGMGEIFLARQQGPAGFEKVVVIKRILSHLTDNVAYLEAFLQEARLQARMNHSSIVQIFDLGQAEDDGSFYLAMEYVHGKSLFELLARLKQLGEYLPPVLVAGILERAADGLSYAHNLADNTGRCLNIVHRDISPHNVLLSYQGDVKLIDFGIAKSDVNSVKTEAGTIKGKFFYMSPEQSAAQAIDKRSDLFSLGIVLYETLTGENPFMRANVILALEAIQKQDPPPPSTVDPAFAPFDPIIAKVLAKNPDDRYADASDLKDDLALARAQLPPSPEKLGALLQRIFKDKVEQENRVLVETDSASLGALNRNGTGARTGSGPKPMPGATPRPKAVTGSGPKPIALTRPVEPAPSQEDEELDSAATLVPRSGGPSLSAETFLSTQSEEETEDPGSTLISEPVAAVKRPSRAPPRPAPKPEPEDAPEAVGSDTLASDEALAAQIRPSRTPLYLALGVAVVLAGGAGVYFGRSAANGPFDAVERPVRPQEDPEQAQRKAEARRLAEEKAAEEAKQAEAKRLADEQQAAEDAKKTEAQRLADEKRTADEAKKAEAQRLADEKRAADEAKKAEAQRLADEKRAADEAKRAEAQRLADEKKAADEAKRAEAKRLADEKKAADEAKRAEAKRLADEKKAADEAKRAEAKRLADEKKAADEAKKAEAKRLADERAAEARKTAKVEKVASAGAVLGTLILKATPAATLKLNGKPVGERISLPSSAGTIEVTGGPLQLTLAYTAKGLELQSEPWAIAYENGVSKGKTPVSIPLDGETRRIELKRPKLDQPVQLLLRFSKP